MEPKELFSPKEYLYLYCFHRLPEGKKTAKTLSDAMGIASSTVYDNIKPLTAKGFLAKKGRGYVLTEKGLTTVDTDRETFDNLVFWILDNLGCAENVAWRIATDFICKQPIAILRRLASAAASSTALLRAGGPAEQPLAAFSPGRHDAEFSVRGPSGDENEETEHAARKPAVFIVGKEGECVIELYAPHIRRIAASAMPKSNRAIPKRLLYMLGDDMIECRELAGRWHIRGDAVMTGYAAADGELTGSVRVFAENGRRERYGAEILLRFGHDAAV